ncbi:SAUR-like auxin-responsive protein family [Forsythia ovata]|uniref:SAUR-like auxin-responsive protein family n=1 Tax=Forsythia ovata TaxID=205694 RepID=A0ABD1VIS6_9LAMI
MAKCRTSGKKKNGIVMLKIVVEKLQKSLFLGWKNSSDLAEFEEEMRESKNVPNDVKEGHFAVIAVDDDELKRFIVPLSYLTHPSFLRLLEQSAEEYGFDQDGALTIPCRPTELERILAERWVVQRDSSFLVNWPASCRKTMLELLNIYTHHHVICMD